MKRALFCLLAIGAVLGVQARFEPRAIAPVAPVHIETFEPSEATPYLEPGTLVIFEIENTLMEPESQLGSEQWADAAQHLFAAPGSHALDARAGLMPHWNRVLMRAKVRPVDHQIQAYLRCLQRAGYPVMGLSRKDPDAAYILLDHLKSVDVNFVRSPLHSGYLTVEGAAYPAKLVENLLMTGVYNNSGEVLADLFDQIEYVPFKVIMFSNKYETLRSTYDGLASHGIPFVGIRLAHADERIHSFRPELAEIQFNFFQKPLTNEAAMALAPQRGWLW